MIRYNRQKLKAHDKGSDRHNKPVAHESKQVRLDTEHVRAASGRRRSKKKKISCEFTHCSCSNDHATVV